MSLTAVAIRQRGVESKLSKIPAMPGSMPGNELNFLLYCYFLIGRFKNGRSTHKNYGRGIFEGISIDIYMSFVYFSKGYSVFFD